MKIKLKQFKEEGSKEWIEKEIYLDGFLKSNLDLGKNQLKKDWDQVWFIDGAEGAGKSVLGVTAAYYASPPERRHNLIERVIVKIEDAPSVIKNALVNDSVVIDESFGGMSAAGFMNKLNKMLQRLFTEIRAKNLFIFVIAPTFMDINRYFAIWRSKCLLHVYSTKGERGYCAFFNSDLKKKLYIMGKKQFYNYQCIQPNFRFRFTNGGTKLIDWDEYKRRKSEKNLEIEEEDYVPQPVMRKCWIRIREKMGELTKPLTQVQFSELSGMCERSIKGYDAAIKRAKCRGNSILSNLNEKDNCVDDNETNKEGKKEFIEDNNG